MTRSIAGSLKGRCCAHHDSALKVLQLPANGSMSCPLLSWISRCRCGPVESPELPITPRNSPASTDAPNPLLVSEPALRCPYHAVDPSGCRTYTAFHRLSLSSQLRSNCPSSFITMAPDAAATTIASSLSILRHPKGNDVMSVP